METAVMQAAPASGVEDENLVTIEATEDREIRFVALSLTDGNLLAEVSFSSTFELNDATSNSADDTASGVLIAERGRSSDGAAGDPLQVIYYDSAPPIWEAGEEINLHTNNFSAAEEQVRVIIGYVPVGEFNRSRLRNR